VGFYIIAVITYGGRMLGFYFADKADQLAYEKQDLSEFNNNDLWEEG
jgi:hypothetical protein